VAARFYQARGFEMHGHAYLRNARNYDVGRLVADALQCEGDFRHPLGNLVHQKTGGNPFFAIQFLTALAEEGLLNPEVGTLEILRAALSEDFGQGR
jgi:predicted ATPase